MKAKLVLLPGDGIGPEVVAEARLVLDEVARLAGHEFSYEEHVVGGCAIDKTGNPLPEDTLNACRDADAILLGAVGGPKWDDPTSAVRPEQGLLGLRKALGLYANLRPVTIYPSLVKASPVKPEILAARRDSGGFAQTPSDEQLLVPAGYNQLSVRWVASGGAVVGATRESSSSDRSRTATPA